MENKKYQCKNCGAVVIGELARREHCQIHHPGTPFKRLDIYFSMDFREVNGEASATAVVRPAKSVKVRADKHGNVTYVTNKASRNVSSFDCSKAIPIDVPRRPESTSADDLFEFAVKRVAEIHDGKTTLLDPKTIIEFASRFVSAICKSNGRKVMMEILERMKKKKI